MNSRIFFTLVLLCITGVAVRSAQDGQQLHSYVSRSKRSAFLATLNFEETNTRAVERVCGVRRSAVPDVFTRIVGGSVAEKHEFPWQVSLQWSYRWYSYHVCGATLLSASWVVTAAHCTHQFKPRDILLIAGIHNIRNKEGSEQRRKVDRLAEHWGYNPGTQDNDIALLHVAEPFVVDGLTVSPVCLPQPKHVFRGNCVVSGWGKLTESGSSAVELRKVVVPIITKQQCQESYRTIGYHGPISDSMLCAGYSQGVKDACQGDSGGPFVCRGRDNRFQLAGVVSWGVGCARPNVPGVYTAVSRFIPWITSIVHGRAEVFERAANVRTSLHLDDLQELQELPGGEQQHPEEQQHSGEQQHREEQQHPEERQLPEHQQLPGEEQLLQEQHLPVEQHFPGQQQLPQLQEESDQQQLEEIQEEPIVHLPDEIKELSETEPSSNEVTRIMDEYRYEYQHEILLPTPVNGAVMLEDYPL